MKWIDSYSRASRGPSNGGRQGSLGPRGEIITFYYHCTLASVMRCADSSTSQWLPLRPTLRSLTPSRDSSLLDSQFALSSSPYYKCSFLFSLSPTSNSATQLTPRKVCEGETRAKPRASSKSRAKQVLFPQANSAQVGEFTASELSSRVRVDWHSGERRRRQSVD